MKFYVGHDYTSDPTQSALLFKQLTIEYRCGIRISSKYNSKNSDEKWNFQSYGPLKQPITKFSYLISVLSQLNENLQSTMFHTSIKFFQINTYATEVSHAII